MLFSTTVKSLGADNQKTASSTCSSPAFHTSLLRNVRPLCSIDIRNQAISANRTSSHAHAQHEHVAKNRTYFKFPLTPHVRTPVFFSATIKSLRADNQRTVSLRWSSRTFLTSLLRNVRPLCSVDTRNQTVCTNHTSSYTHALHEHVAKNHTSFKFQKMA